MTNGYEEPATFQLERQSCPSSLSAAFIQVILMPNRRWIVAALLLATSAYAQDDDDEQPPGLLARYQVGPAAIERIDPDIAFQWTDQPPDERLPAGKFTATWSGSLLVRSAEKYRFHAFVQGKVSLTVSGKAVLEGTATEPQWLSGPATDLSFGDQPFELTYARTGDAGQLKLYWSASDFPLEPVPYHALFQTKPSPNLTLIEKGRVQFDAFRCGNCHTAGREQKDSERLQAPSLKHAGAGTNREWLIEKLIQGAGEAKAPWQVSAKMPHFGFDRDEAEAIVTALFVKTQPVEWVAAAKPKESERAKDLQAGQTLVRSVGCLACHTWKSLGEVTPYGGGSLDDLDNRRSHAWVTTWLTNPARLNPHHRMPVVTLTDKERSQIVLALTEPSKPSVSVPDTKAKPPEDAVVARGVKLIETARCSLCHELPDIKPDSKPVLSLTDAKVNWERGCTLPPARAKNRPGFTQVDAKALQAYVASWPAGTAIRPVNTEQTNSLTGRRLLDRKNCLSCHDRDDARGISKHAAAIAKSDETLAGLHMTLIPPRLNAVGDRMHDAGLAEAIRGDLKTPRLPWLKVRMPKFAHSPGDQAALLAHLIGHDRIPDANPDRPIPADSIAKAEDAQQILAGRELLGGKGFSCVACHAVKEYTPKVTALGTRGSNLHLIGQRMRTDYFFRWTRAPLRVMPGVEMPNYQKPHEFILPGKLDEQLIAMWQALNDPNLTSPTNPAVVEQLLSIADQTRPRVVRDVFTIAGSNETVARACAIGLSTGHSVLVDLDTDSICGWTLGDFARQRCEGKRWFWDLAGTVLATGFERRPDILFRHRETKEIIAPETGWEFSYELKNIGTHTSAVAIFSTLRCSKEGVVHEIGVCDIFDRSPELAIKHLERSLYVGTEKTLEPWFRKQNPKSLHEQARIEITFSGSESGTGLLESAVPFKTSPLGVVVKTSYQTPLRWELPRSAPPPPLESRADLITTVPGFNGQRLPLPRSIMPTAIAWDHKERLIFTSLKGHLFGLPKSSSQKLNLDVIDEGLAAPYGVMEWDHSEGNPQLPEFVREVSSILVAHKPELLRLHVNADGSVTHRDVVATGWGVTDDYHDWTCGIAKDSKGNLFIGLGSDYTFKNRPQTKSKWRGDILRIDRKGQIESIARGLRYPTGLAIDDQDRLFVSDQQGVQNTFNELDYIQVGHRYGVPSRHEPEPNAPADPPAVQIPHPWTRSVNGIVFVPKKADKLSPWAGQFIGCEMNNNMLVRMSIQTVGDTVQGAVYPFSKPAKEGDPHNFVGPLCIGISPSQDIYVGGLQDGGWAGGLNVGDIVKLTPNSDVPNGIREIRATRNGFDIEFFHKVDAQLAADTSHYKISGYTRVWKGDYATPDSGHHSGEITSAAISGDGRTVSLTVGGRKPGHVYDISVGEIGTEPQRTLWPSLGHYTLHRIPE